MLMQSSHHGIFRHIAQFHPELTAFRRDLHAHPELGFEEVAASLVGQDRVVRHLPPSMGAEDFSFMLQVKPGAYLRIGQGQESGDAGCFLHSSRYDFNDEIPCRWVRHSSHPWSNRRCLSH